MTAYQPGVSVAVSRPHPGHQLGIGLGYVDSYTADAIEVPAIRFPGVRTWA
jgi:hypothetical protein